MHEVRLSFEGQRGYLRSVLAALRIPVESQLPVFSKRSIRAQTTKRERDERDWFPGVRVRPMVGSGQLEDGAWPTARDAIF